MLHGRRFFAGLSAATFGRGPSAEDILRLGSVELGRAARRSLSEGDLAEERWSSYAARAQELAPELGFDEAARLLSAFSTARYVDFPLFAKISARALECLPRQDQGAASFEIADDVNPERSVSASDLRRIAIALGRSQAFDSELVQAMVPLIAGRVEHFRPRELVHIVDAYARMPVQAPELFAMAAEALPAYLYDLEPSELASLCRSFAEAAFYNEELSDALAAEVTQRARNFGAKECLVFIDGLSRLHEGLPEEMLAVRKARDADSIAAMSQQLGGSASSLSAPDLVRAFAALVRLDHYEPRLVHGRICPALALKLTQLAEAPGGAPWARPPQSAGGFAGLAELLHCLSLLPAQSQKSAELALATSRCLVEWLQKALKQHQDDLGRKGAKSASVASGRLPGPRAMALAAAACAQLGRQGQEDEELLSLLAASLTGVMSEERPAAADGGSSPSLSLASEEELQDLERAFGLCRSSAAASACTIIQAELQQRSQSAGDIPQNRLIVS
eukprot:TRINITY_DN4661_c0_g1_i1.p1 TRINITY_DN4661_c0_g1~~TRINITY_DN4661_c0_g1_i1.p1  ORF type:complete len:506 (-),score=110.67 TRINITY_DN4661_c0_g1_i1:50-1567(-)